MPFLLFFFHFGIKNCTKTWKNTESGDFYQCFEYTATKRLSKYTTPNAFKKIPQFFSVIDNQRWNRSSQKEQEEKPKTSLK